MSRFAPSRLALVALAALTAGCSPEARFARVEALWLLWLVPLVVVFLVERGRARRRDLRRFASGRMLELLSRRVSASRRVFKAILLIVALTAGLLTLAEPQWGYTWEEVEREGVDLVVAIDVSRSMLARDVESGGGLSRLDRARREIVDLLRRLEGDRVAIVAFAGTAFVECPLTLDYGAAALFVDSLDPELIPLAGSDVGAALRTSIEALEESSEGARAVLLLTDGEDHGDEALDAAEEARRAGVRVFAIGIGGVAGAPIPSPSGGSHRDRSGEVVVSRLEEATLQRIALATGGRYVRSTSGDLDLESVYDEGIKATLDDVQLAEERRRNWHARFQWPLAVALVALALEALVPEAAPRRRRQDVAEAVDAS